MILRIARHHGFAWAFLGIALCVGCNRAPARPKVHGEVTINGTPVKQGEIKFAPSDGGGSPVSTTISDGHYTVESTPGKKRVEIQAYDQRGTKPIDPAMPGSATVPVLKPLLPAKYNSASELTLDVNAETEKNFEISLP